MDISILEFAVYGLICYSGLLMLIISTIKEVPTGRASSIVRAIYLIPSIICAGILASSGVNITTNDQTTTTVIHNVNSTETWTQTDAISSAIILQNPVWITVHVMIFIVLLIYVITQLVSLLTKTGKEI